MFRDDRIPATEKKVRVRRVRAAETLMITVVGRRVHGFRSHWAGSYTDACNGGSGTQCTGCERQWPVRWRGYLDCIDQNTRERVFIELTASGAAQVLDVCGGEDSLRGSRVEVSRGRGAKTALTFRLRERMPDVERWIPQELDPEKAVGELYAYRPNQRKQKTYQQAAKPTDGIGEMEGYTHAEE